MAIFGSDKAALLARLRKRDWRSPEHRDELLQQVREHDLALPEVAWMVFSRERAVRHLGAEFLRARRYPGACDELLKQARSDPEAPRSTLLPVFVELADATTLLRLGTIVRDGEPSERDIAVDLVLAFPFERAREYVFRILRHPERELRMRALRRVLELRTPGATGPGDPAGLEAAIRKHLVALARDPEERIRTTVLQALGQGPDDEALDLLVERLRADTYGVRRVVAQLLDTLADAHDPRLIDRLVPLLSDGDDRVREIAFRVAFKVGDPTDLIQRVILFSKTLMGWMRDRIHQTISAFGEAVIEPVVRLFTHPDEDIRNAALIFATHFHSERLIPPLLALVGDSNWWTRVIAIETLGHYKDERAVDVLIGCLADEEVRWSAVEALANIGSSRALVPIAKLLRDAAPDVRKEVIRALEVYNDQRALPLLEQCFKTDPELAVREQALNAYRSIAKKNKVDVDDAQLREKASNLSAGTTLLERLLVATRRIGASDLHISANSAPAVRINGDLRLLGEAEGVGAFSADQVRQMVNEILDDDQRRRLGRDRQLDLCLDVPNVGRYRANVFLEMRGMGAVFRVIPNEIPDFEYTGLPTYLMDVANHTQGLVLVSGTSGSGKTTTLAALVNLVNERKRGHIITIEDPIEFVHPYRRCLVSQRTVGRDTTSFPAALRAALREDPDVVVIGEMRDVETTRLALDAAETGHLVIGTMQTTSAPKTVRRLIDVFPPREQPQVRLTVAESLKFVICQTLLPAKGGGRVPAHEILVMNVAIAHAIREEKDNLIPSLMQMGRRLGMQTLDESLLALVRAGRVAPEDAYRRADKKESFEEFVSDSFLQSVYD